MRRGEERWRGGEVGIDVGVGKGRGSMRSER